MSNKLPERSLFRALRRFHFSRKEAKRMSYTKPTFNLIGYAATAIQSQLPKQGFVDDFFLCDHYVTVNAYEADE